MKVKEREKIGPANIHQKKTWLASLILDKVGFRTNNYQEQREKLNSEKRKKNHKCTCTEQQKWNISEGKTDKVERKIKYTLLIRDINTSLLTVDMQKDQQDIE